MRHSLVSARLSARRLLTAVVGTLAVACADPMPVERAAGPNGWPATPPPAPTLATVPYIYVADADGTVRGRLTVGMWPSWSPDGRRLLFERDWNVWVIDADGSNERLLVAGRWPTWALDGATIAFVAEKRILIMNADSLGARTLMTPTLNIMSPFDEVGRLAWSPDGKTIAFQTLSMEWPSKIILINADGSAERGLTSLGRMGGEERGRRQMVAGRLPASVLERRRATPNIGPDHRNTDHRVRRRRIRRARCVVSGRPHHHVQHRGDNPSIVRVPANGGVATSFIEDGRQAAWSPDGKRIAFVRAHKR